MFGAQIFLGLIQFRGSKNVWGKKNWGTFFGGVINVGG